MRAIAVCVLIASTSACVGHIALRPESARFSRFADAEVGDPDGVGEELPLTTRRQFALYEGCQARLYFLGDTENRLRSWNTGLSVVTALLSLVSGSTGLLTMLTNDGSAEDAVLAVTSGASGVVAIVVAAVRLFTTTDDHSYVRAAQSRMATGLRATASGTINLDDALSVCNEIESDLGLPAPDIAELTYVNNELASYYRLNAGLLRLTPSLSSVIVDGVSVGVPAPPPIAPADDDGRHDGVEAIGAGGL